MGEHLIQGKSVGHLNHGQFGPFWPNKVREMIFKNRYYLDISEYQGKLGSLSIVSFSCRAVWFESCLHLRFR